MSAELALRRLQQWDQVAGRVSVDDARTLIIEAQDALAAALGLECTGVKDGPGMYEHNGDTCPVHEWLEPNDCRKVERRFRLERSGANT